MDSGSVERRKVDVMVMETMFEPAHGWETAVQSDVELKVDRWANPVKDSSENTSMSASCLSQILRYLHACPTLG